ncbi:MAG TPA: AbrB/MazE/SpoVT family DNA-binding domain-containing protein [Candidatus Sulfotelmatobacter sp.]|jgi:AbrB family looped-hinge helix DNA binding protein
MSIHSFAVEYLTSTRIGEKGQLTVPKEFREDLGLGNGSPFTVLRIGDGLLLLPEQQRFEELCQRISSQLTAASLEPQEILATLPEIRRDIYERRYGKKSRARMRRGTRSHPLR